MPKNILVIFFLPTQYPILPWQLVSQDVHILLPLITTVTVTFTKLIGSLTSNLLKSFKPPNVTSSAMEFHIFSLPKRTFSLVLICLTLCLLNQPQSADNQYSVFPETTPNWATKDKSNLWPLTSPYIV